MRRKVIWFMSETEISEWCRELFEIFWVLPVLFAAETVCRIKQGHTPKRSWPYLHVKVRGETSSEAKLSHPKEARNTTKQGKLTRLSHSERENRRFMWKWELRGGGEFETSTRWVLAFRVRGSQPWFMLLRQGVTTRPTIPRAMHVINYNPRSYRKWLPERTRDKYSGVHRSNLRLPSVFSDWPICPHTQVSSHTPLLVG